VAGELRKLIAVSDVPIRLWYWRPHAGREVDFLLERGEQLVAALRTCMQDLKGRVRLGILLSPGAEVLALDRHTLAVPFHTFFGVA